MNLSVPIMVVLLCQFPLIWVPGSAADTVLLRWAVLLSLSLFALYVIIRQRLLRYDSAFVPLALFLFFIFLSALLSEHTSIVWIGRTPYRYTGFLTYLCFAVLFLLAFSTALRHPEKMNIIINIFLLSAALIAFIGLLQYVGLNQKSHATLLNPNHYGTYMVMVFPFAAVRLLQNPGARWSVIVFVLVYAALLTSLCRGAWVGMLFGLVLLLIYYPDKRRLRHLAVLILMVTVLIAPLNDWRFVKQAASFTDEVEMALERDPDTGSKRFIIWQEAVKALPGSVLVGTGPDTLLYGNKRIEKSPTKAHNIYLEIGVTMGIPALVAYLWLLGHCLRRADRSTPLGLASFLMVATYLVQGVFLVDVLSVYPLFWSLLGVGIGLSRSMTVLPNARL